MTAPDGGGTVVAGPTGALFHIAEPADWKPSAPLYRAPSLDAEGFIHLSTADQVRPTTARHYAGRTDLLLLVIDPEQVNGSAIRWEAAPHGESFPHLYGPLPVTAVTEVRAWPD